MRFASYLNPPVSTLIEAAAGAGKLSLLIGAGASMEAGLPSWEQLLDRLLIRGGEHAGLIAATSSDGELTDEQDETRRRWLTEASRDGPLGKAAMVDALAGSQRDRWIADELFRPNRGPASYHPGPIARQIPLLFEAFEPGSLRVMTTNYDDLIEQALRQGVTDLVPRPLPTEDQSLAAGEIGIAHLHGYLGRDGGPQGELVLSEADYMQMQQGTSWQESLVRTALSESTVVFVGTSMLDPNVIRYLHGAARPSGLTPTRFALFVRQGTYAEEVPSKVRSAREQALARRWEALGVVAVFVDHFTDIAQVLSEIARQRRLGDGRPRLAARAVDWIDTVEHEILGVGDDLRFRTAQDVLNRLLRSTLERAVSAAERLTERPWAETLQLALWLVDREGCHLTNWVMTDRLHVDQRTIEPVPIDEYARWLAVRTFCAGTSLAETRSVYASRWKFVRGTPLVLDSDHHGRLPVGCLTTASLAPKGATQLDGLRGDVVAAFNDALCETVLELLDAPFRSTSVPSTLYNKRP